MTTTPGRDGMIKDKAAASDVYIYQIQYTIVGGTNIYTERGDVTLLGKNSVGNLFFLKMLLKRHGQHLPVTAQSV
ncbi:MAG: hypothetical protein R2825_07820 [Saprospiraceae bacterium]